MCVCFCVTFNAYINEYIAVSTVALGARESKQHTYAQIDSSRTATAIEERAYRRERASKRPGDVGACMATGKLNVRRSSVVRERMQRTWSICERASERVSVCACVRAFACAERARL